MNRLNLIVWAFVLWSTGLYAQQKEFNAIVYYSAPDEVSVEFCNLSENEMVVLLDWGSYAYFYEHSGQYKSDKLIKYEFEATDSMNVLIKIPSHKIYIKKYKVVDRSLLKAYIKIDYSFNFSSPPADCQWDKYSEELNILPYGARSANMKKNKLVKKEIMSGDFIYDKLELNPEFPGGRNALILYLNKKINKYLTTDNQEHIRIRVVIEKDGSISHPYAIMDKNPLGKIPSLRKAALEIVEQMPKWKPGFIKGKPVRSYYTISIFFKLKS